MMVFKPSMMNVFFWPNKEGMINIFIYNGPFFTVMKMHFQEQYKSYCLQLIVELAARSAY